MGCFSMDCKLITPPSIPSQAIVDNAAKGIQTGIIALYIMTAKNINRSLIQEHTFKKVMRLITFHIINNFAPCKDEEFRIEFQHFFNNQIEDKKTKTKRKKSKKKKKKKEDNERQNEYWLNMNHLINPLYADFCSSLLLLMNIYIEKEVVREQEITQLLKCCFHTFNIQNTDDIQDGCKSLLITMFVKYEEHRNDLQCLILEYYRNADRTYYAKRKIAETKDKESNSIHLIN